MSEPLLIYIEHNFMTFWIFIFTLINTAILCGMFIAQLLNRRDFKKEQTKKQLEKTVHDLVIKIKDQPEQSTEKP